MTKKVKTKKTNALRILDLNNVEYSLYEYEYTDEHITGSEVARIIGKSEEIVFKTLVCKSGKTHYVFVLPVNQELNLKKAAVIAGEKKIEMIPLKELLPATGYLHGGCSPLGMKRDYKTYFDETALIIDNIVFSAGLRGLQCEIRVELLSKFDFEYADLT